MLGRRAWRLLGALSVCLGFAVPPAGAAMDSYPIARLRMLDKVTARTSTFDVKVDTTVRFGQLYIKPRACRKAPPIDAPESASFLQIWEVNAKDQPEWIFSGWMFASSPALSSMDHPIYDVWVLDCLGGAPQAEAVPQPVAPSTSGTQQQDVPSVPAAASEEQQGQPVSAETASPSSADASPPDSSADAPLTESPGEEMPPEEVPPPSTDDQPEDPSDPGIEVAPPVEPVPANEAPSTEVSPSVIQDPVY